jgi:hypothetical protein
MNHEKLTLIICTTIVALSAIFGCAYYFSNQTKLMAETITAASAKGVDPLAVRCSFASSNDTICLIYASALNLPSSGSTASPSAKK